MLLLNTFYSAGLRIKTWALNKIYFMWMQKINTRRTSVTKENRCDFNPCCLPQWECKTDMEHAYRFGRIEVSCEGYSHPADAYILKGSCGLEYSLELTEEGRRKTQGSRGSHSGFSGGGKIEILD